MAHHLEKLILPVCR